jgi:DNA-binding response OmpR family regulator
MTTTKILLVEDEAPIRAGLADALTAEGYAVTAVGDVRGALAALGSDPDLIVLDRRLPDGEGLVVLRAARALPRSVGVIVVSARGLTEDRVAGLEDGADDYVTKPFHLRELLARIRAVLGRTGPERARPGRHLVAGTLAIDLAARTARVGRRALELTRLEFDLLAYLVRQEGRVVPRAELLERVWGYNPSSRTVDFHAQALRRKLGALGERLVTVPGIGYRWDRAATA